MQDYFSGKALGDPNKYGNVLFKKSATGDLWNPYVFQQGTPYSGMNQMAGIDLINPGYAPSEVTIGGQKLYKTAPGASGGYWGYSLTAPTPTGGQNTVPKSNPVNPVTPPVTPPVSPVNTTPPPVQNPVTTAPTETPVGTPATMPYQTQPVFTNTGEVNVVDSQPTQLGQMTQYTPKSFQFSDTYNNILNSLKSYNPNYQQAEVQPVQWTPEQIQNMYSTQFADLDRAQQMATKQIENALQERFQGRSGQLITQLGDNAYDFNRQRENVMADVLGQILPQQEQLTQGRQTLAQQAEALRQGGYQTGMQMLNTVGNQEVQGEQMNVANIAAAVQRTSQGIQDALAVGNFEEASRLGQMQMELEQARLNLDTQGQGFNQNLQKQNQLGNLLSTLLSYNLGEVQDFTSQRNNLWDNIVRMTGL